MVLESTMICVDNSDFMRNGDFVPTRFQAQQDAVNLVCHSRTRANPENNVGLLTLSNTEVLSTLNTDTGRILAKLHQVQLKGLIKFVSGVRIAHLVLKHRMGKNHKMRIIVFVGSPVEEEEKEIVKLAKRLKKEKVNVDVINFGEENSNTDKLASFINTINGKDGSSSHLVTVTSGPMLSDALVSSPIIVGEDGAGSVPGGMAGFEYGFDPNEDPELALALRVSMEEQRARQEDDAKKTQTEGATDQTTSGGAAAPGESSEEAILKQALEMSMQSDDTVVNPASNAASTEPDFSAMTEEEQFAYAMQMSLSSPTEMSATPSMDTETPMEIGEKSASDKEKDDEDYSEVMSDPAFLESVLQGLPGVDPRSEAVQNAMEALSKKDDSKSDKDPSSKDK